MGKRSYHAEVQRCPVCHKDWRMPLNHRECVESVTATTPAAVERVALLERILLDIIYASDQCVGHRECGHSMQPWKDARAALAMMERPLLACECRPAIVCPSHQTATTPDAVERMAREAYEAFCKQFCSPGAETVVWYWTIWITAWKTAIAAMRREG